MTVSFACPSCGAKGSVGVALVGKQVRCKHCRYHFAVPSPGDREPEVYAMDGPGEPAAGVVTADPSPDPVFVPSRGGEPKTAGPPRSPKRGGAGSTVLNNRPGRGPDLARRSWLVKGGVAAAAVIAATALIAPRGALIAGCLLLILGGPMVVMGFLAGAYGAFREDFLYGVLFLAIPLYAGYYVVTRWDDLWVWFACSTAGVVLVTIGTWLVQISTATP